jgi:N-acetylated-alpha-linked acidic dipeptidase
MPTQRGSLELHLLPTPRPILLHLFPQSKTSARIYPTYHTAFDTFSYVDKFVDPGKEGVGGIPRLTGRGWA